MSFWKLFSKAKDQNNCEQTVKTYTRRGGRSVETDSVFKAWTSGTLEEMLSVLNVKTHFVDRHHLLMSIVELSYKDRKSASSRKLCKEISALHVQELEKSFPKIIKELGMRPNVSTFKYYSTVLTEDGEFDKAIGVCKLALKHQLSDGTKGGYEGRITRIKAKRGDRPT